MGDVVSIEREKVASQENSTDVQSAGWKWINWAWEQRLGNATLKSVLVALAGHANAKGECWPSVSRLCDRSDAKVRAVQNALRELERRGLIVTMPRTGTSNLYRLTPVNNTPLQEMHPAGDAEAPRTGCSLPPQEMQASPAGDAPKLPRTPKEQPSEDIAPLQAQTNDLPDDFLNQFLAVYPKKGYPIETGVALKKAVLDDGAVFDEILHGAAAYAAEVKDREKKFIKNSENWVKKARWVQYQRPADNLDQTVDLYADMIRSGKRIFGGPLKLDVRSELQSRHGLGSREIDAALVSV